MDEVLELLTPSSPRARRRLGLICLDVFLFVAILWALFAPTANSGDLGPTSGYREPDLERYVAAQAAASRAVGNVPRPWAVNRSGSHGGRRRARKHQRRKQQQQLGSAARRGRPLGAVDEAPDDAGEDMSGSDMSSRARRGSKASSFCESHSWPAPAGQARVRTFLGRSAARGGAEFVARRAAGRQGRRCRGGRAAGQRARRGARARADGRGGGLYSLLYCVYRRASCTV